MPENQNNFAGNKKKEIQKRIGLDQILTKATVFYMC